MKSEDLTILSRNGTLTSVPDADFEIGDEEMAAFGYIDIPHSRLGVTNSTGQQQSNNFVLPVQFSNDNVRIRPMSLNSNGSGSA